MVQHAMAPIAACRPKPEAVLSESRDVSWKLLFCRTGADLRAACRVIQHALAGAGRFDGAPAAGSPSHSLAGAPLQSDDMYGTVPSAGFGDLQPAFPRATRPNDRVTLGRFLEAFLKLCLRVLQTALDAAQGPQGFEPLRLRGGGRRRKRPPPASPPRQEAGGSDGGAAAMAAADAGQVAAAQVATASTGARAEAAAEAEPKPAPRKRRKTAVTAEVAAEAAAQASAAADDSTGATEGVAAVAAGSGASAFAIGAAVEVTNDEDGLRGCW